MSGPKFADRASGDVLIKALRKGDEYDWVLFGYDSKGDTIVEQGKGKGGLDELKPHLDPNAIQYALLRTTDVFDGHTTVKFVWILWVGDKVKVFRKATTATHKGAVGDFFGQRHVEIYASTLEELTMDNIMAKVTAASGSFNKVLEKKAETHSPAEASDHPAPAPKPAGKIASESTSTFVTAPKPSAHIVATKSIKDALAFEDEEGSRAAIKQLRNDADPLSWVLFGYKNKSDGAIVLVGSGKGGVDELAGHLTTDGVYYGLYRTILDYDGHATVKFVFIIFIGEKISVVKKAKVATHKGAVTDFIGQYHVDLTATSIDEVSPDIILKLVKTNSGKDSEVVKEKKDA